jgi:hypothetical protein
LKTLRSGILVSAAVGLLLAAGEPASAAPSRAEIDSSTWVDHDGRPIAKPKERKISLYGYMFRQAIVEPISHLFDVPDKLIWAAGPIGVHRERHASNVNRFDEVPNSTWFTNRNHFRAVRPEEIRTGPFGGVFPTKPWTVTSIKKTGYNVGFQIKDAEGRKWLIKLDSSQNPQAGSGAGTVTSRLVWAAGYNLALYQPVNFRREDLRLDAHVAGASPPEPARASQERRTGAAKPAAAPAKQPKAADPPITDAELSGVLSRGAQSSDGRYLGGASLFVPGKPAGPPDLQNKRKDDPNDWFQHKNRRELRGLYVVYSWLNNWDVKDQQSLDMYGPDDPSAHLTHYILDVDASLGAAAEGAKPLPYGYEMRVDFPWTLKRLVTLGFVVEPWRKAHQETGIPSVGNFEAEKFHPKGWRPLEEVPPFRKLTLRDAYWGAKLVASFSDAQIAAAIDAASYEDPRAREYILKTLIERRDKVARYWFDRIAPLDFFRVEGGVLSFHDLATDIGLTGPREYEVKIEGLRDERMARQRFRATQWTLPASGSSGLSLTLSVSGSAARPVRLDLRRQGSDWIITRVRHA